VLPNGLVGGDLGEVKKTVKRRRSAGLRVWGKKKGGDGGHSEQNNKGGVKC